MCDVQGYFPSGGPVSLHQGAATGSLSPHPSPESEVRKPKQNSDCQVCLQTTESKILEAAQGLLMQKVLDVYTSRAYCLSVHHESPLSRDPAHTSHALLTAASLQEDREAQRGQILCPRLCCEYIVELEFEHRSLKLAFFPCFSPSIFK